MIIPFEGSVEEYASNPLNLTELDYMDREYRKLKKELASYKCTIRLALAMLLGLSVFSSVIFLTNNKEAVLYLAIFTLLCTFFCTSLLVKQSKLSRRNFCFPLEFNSHYFSRMVNEEIFHTYEPFKPVTSPRDIEGTTTSKLGQTLIKSLIEQSRDVTNFELELIGFMEVNHL